jgi:formamidopyrimidine-DNA glycosylase
MPELAEVEFYRKQWNAGLGRRVIRVRVHERARVFRGCRVGALARALSGATLRSSAAAAKLMLFRFSGRRWLGLHLGMSGALRTENAGFTPGPHDHLVLVQPGRCLVFSDPRMFGRVRFSTGAHPPPWWTRLPPSVLSDSFTVEAIATFFRRHQRSPVKAVLLMQDRFPGIGNWMADEILWRAAVHPARLAGSLSRAETATLWRECRRICRVALAVIAGHGRSTPSALNVRIPDTWLFNHRWEDGGRCPRTGVPLVREMIGGRTTCWSPARQRPRADPCQL